MATSIQPLISVIVPAYNEEAFLDKCLSSLQKQDLNPKEFEVIVIDNASTDKTAVIAKKYPFKLVAESRRSVVIARQRGVEVSRGKIIASADADTVYPKHWLSRIKYDFESNPKLVCVVGWLYYNKTGTFFNISNGFSQQINLLLSKFTGKFHLAFASNMAFKRTAIEAIGGYPSHLPELGDQQYLLYQFFQLGKVIVDKKLSCRTSARRITHSAWKDIFIYNGWHRLVGYPINRFMGKQIIGPSPAIRTTSGKLGRSKFLARLERFF